MSKKYIAPKNVLIDISTELSLMDTSLIPGTEDDAELGTKRQDFGGSSIWGYSDSDL